MKKSLIQTIRSKGGILGVIALTAVSGIASFAAGRISDGTNVFPSKKKPEDDEDTTKAEDENEEDSEEDEENSEETEEEEDDE